MVHKRHKSLAVAELLSRETNSHFLNPQTNKIDIKLFTKNLHRKDEHADIDLKNRPFDESSLSDNQFLRNLTFDSDADDESASSNQEITQAKNANKKQKVTPRSCKHVSFFLKKNEDKAQAFFLIHDVHRES